MGFIDLYHEYQECEETTYIYLSYDVAINQSCNNKSHDRTCNNTLAHTCYVTDNDRVNNAFSYCSF